MAEPMSWLKDSEGWAALEKQPESEQEKLQQTKAILEEFETAKLFHEVFARGRGPELLRHLEIMLFETPLYVIAGAIGYAELQIPLSPAEWAMVRTGQNSVLHHIRAMLVKAVEGPPDVEGNQDG